MEAPPLLLPHWLGANFSFATPLSSWGSRHHPKADRGAPEGGSGPAKNDCPSVNNLLLLRAVGSEARTEHNGFLGLKGPGSGASEGSRNAEALNPGTRVSCLALLYPSSLHKCRHHQPQKQETEKAKGLATASICKPKHAGFTLQDTESDSVTIRMR